MAKRPKPSNGTSAKRDMDANPPPAPQAVTFVVSPYHDDGFVVRENHCPVAGDYRQRDGTDRWVAWHAGVQDLAADLHAGGAGLVKAMARVPGPLTEAHCRHLNQEHAHGRVAQAKCSESVPCDFDRVHVQLDTELRPDLRACLVLCPIHSDPGRVLPTAAQVRIEQAARKLSRGAKSGQPPEDCRCGYDHGTEALEAAKWHEHDARVKRAQRQTQENEAT